MLVAAWDKNIWLICFALNNHLLANKGTISRDSYPNTQIHAGRVYQNQGRREV